MFVYGMWLVVLFFCRESLVEEYEGFVGEGQRFSFLFSYIIDVWVLDEKLFNIIDLQFLYGYYEFIFFILFEFNQIWFGCVVVWQDMCFIVVILLNIMQKVYFVIWFFISLFFDCIQVLVVFKFIGGVVVFVVNLLLYLNQSVFLYGVVFNSFIIGIMVFLFCIQEGVWIILDCVQVIFIFYDKMVIFFKGGEIYVLIFIIDGMCSV